MLVSTVVHPLAAKETSLEGGEASSGASRTLVAAGGSPPQRGWHQLAPTAPSIHCEDFEGASVLF